MILPSGVHYHPLQRQLIAHDAEAVIRIDQVKVPENGAYVIEQRMFDDSFERCMKGDWDEFDRIFHLARLTDSSKPDRVAVSATARHTGKPRRPGITVVPNLRAHQMSDTGRPLHILGCTLDRYYVKPDSGTVVRHVYEFMSYGMMLIDVGFGEVDLWIARAGDKVVVNSGSSMALYNLGDEHTPLVTLDFCNDEGKLIEERFASEVGPMLLVCYDDLEVNFAINRLYVNNPDVKAGIRVPEKTVETLGRSIRLQRASRDTLGTFLYEQLTYNASLIARFAKLGICIRNIPTDVGLRAPISRGGAQRSLFFSRALARAATEGTRVYRFFFPDSPDATLGPAMPRLRRPEPPMGRAMPKPLDRPLVILVEGAGDWVEKAYRKAFREKLADKKKQYRLSVFYADDASWRGARPDWAVRKPDGLAPWEVYLDKSDPQDVARYALLRPDAVFVVTPDFTHSEMARYWLGKTPLVFVEKPFDSQVRNVEGLQFSLHGRAQTEVVGLDHYQFYAEPLKELQPKIRDLLGERLTEIIFAIVERNAIEKRRDRSLQHGLSLDLLPHCVALLTFFGDIRTIDEIGIPNVWTYEPLESQSADEKDVEDISKTFRNETGSMVEFTLEDYSGNGYRVPCRAVVGKGFLKDAKYMEVTGETGRGLRIDLRSVPTEKDHDYGMTDPLYPWDSFFFLATKSDPHIEVVDPYRPEQKLRLLLGPDGHVLSTKLQRLRYSTLLADLLDGTESASFSSLSMAQGGYIVKVLDRIWWAIQQSKPWDTHALKNFDAIKELDKLR